MERRQFDALRDQLAAIVESSDDAIIGKSLDGVITSWNHGAKRIYGYTAEEAIGRPISMLIPPDHPDELPKILERLRSGERVERYDAERITKEGRRLTLALVISPIHDAKGRLVGASSMARDVTERREVQAALIRAERRAQFLAEASTILAGSLDVETTLSRAAQLAVPDLADWAAVDILDSDGSIRQVALAHADPERVA